MAWIAEIIPSSDADCGERVMSVLDRLAGTPRGPRCDPGKLAAARRRIAEWRAEDEARKARAVAGLSSATHPERGPTPASALNYLAAPVAQDRRAA